LQAKAGPCTNTGREISIDIDGLFAFDGVAPKAQLCFSKKALADPSQSNCASGLLQTINLPTVSLDPVTFHKGGFGKNALACTGNPLISLDMTPTVQDNWFDLGKCNQITYGQGLGACSDIVSVPGNIKLDCSQQGGEIKFWFDYTLGDGDIKEGTCSHGNIKCYNPPSTHVAEQSFITPFAMFDAEDVFIGDTYVYEKSRKWNLDGTWATGQPYVYVKFENGAYQGIGKCAQFRKSDTVVMFP
jgi:hypothetical protein